MLKLIFRKLRKDEDGVAAVEFALIAPMLLALLLGVIEISHYIMIDRRANFATHYLADFIARDSSDSIDTNEMWQANNIFPIVNTTADRLYQINPGFWANRRHHVTYASVDFDAVDPNCQGVNCAYEPDLLWWFNNTQYLGWRNRAMQFNCNDFELSPNSEPLDGTNVPEGMVGRSAVVIASIKYRYSPILTSNFLPVNFFPRIEAMRKTRSGNPLENRMNWYGRRSSHHKFC